MLGVLFEDRVVEVNGEAHLETFIRIKPRPLAVFFDPNRFLDPDKPLGRVLLLDAGGLNQKDERSRASIHDRHFSSTEIHERVVDAQSGQRRQQMFDGRDTHPALNQRGGQPGIPDAFRTSPNAGTAW